MPCSGMPEGSIAALAIVGAVTEPGAICARLRSTYHGIFKGPNRSRPQRQGAGHLYL